jgi:hypothetical protein
MLALALILALAAPSSGERLVTGTGLRVRAAPDANAAIVERVPLGTILPCLEESAPVTVGEATAPFCKTPKGWYFTALTEPALPPEKRAEQIDALIDTRTRALGEGRVDKAAWPDVYALNDLMRRRIDARTNLDDKMRARIAELQLVARYPDVFDKDPRVVRDESQGPRVANNAFEELVRAAKGTSAHEDAAWALYQHGMGGECEGDPVCILIRLDRTACAFLSAFPSGDRAAKAIDDVNETLGSLEPISDPAFKADARTQLAKVRACVERAKSGDTAKSRKLLEDTERAWK